jgi:hypothetical protein
MVRAHARALALSAMPGNSRRSSLARAVNEGCGLSGAGRGSHAIHECAEEKGRGVITDPLTTDPLVGPA